MIDKLTKKRLEENKKNIECKYEKETEIYKTIYEYSSNKIQQLHERKRHIETKSLYVLQASAIVITLFTALLSYLSRFNGKMLYVCIFLIFAFYIIEAIAVITLLLSLNDTIVSWKLTKLLIKFKYNKRWNEEGEDGWYKDTPHPKQAIEKKEKGMDLHSYYKGMDKAFCRTIDSADKINIAKNLYFNEGVKMFVVAIVIVIVLGILVA